MAHVSFFVVPMILMIATLFNHSKPYRRIHFGSTVFYTIMNFFHVIADFCVNPIAWYQIALMVILFIIGLLLNFVSFQWIQERTNGQFLSKY